MELRHECSDMNRAIIRPLWSSVVFRLREPIYDKCKGKLSSAIFRWKFNMIRKKPCRGLIGCHNLESRYDNVTKKQVYDFEGVFTWYLFHSLIEVFVLLKPMARSYGYWDITTFRFLSTTNGNLKMNYSKSLLLMLRMKEFL